jgi:tetratricopeptide (TPR) repeat protein
MERNAAQDALGDLMKWSLVEFNDEARRYRLHDLARLFAKARLSEAGAEEIDAAQRRFAQHYWTVLETCQSLYFEGNESLLRGLALFDQEWSNIQAGQAWAEAKMEKDRDAAQLCLDYSNAGYHCLELRHQPHEHIHWLEVQLAAARQLRRRDHEGAAFCNLGNVYYHLCETRRAIEFYEQCLVIARETGDRASEGSALSGLGLAWADLGETRRAIDLHEQYLAIAREIGDGRGEGNALGNLGLAWADSGEMRKAIEFFKRQLAIAREIGDRKGEGSALNGLGLAWANLGETRKAIEFHEQHLTIAREIGDRRGEGQALRIISLNVYNLGDRTRAIALAEAALKIFEAIESPNAEMVRRKLAKWRGQKQSKWRQWLTRLMHPLGVAALWEEIKHQEQNLAFARANGNRRGEGNALWVLSLMRDKLGNRAKAITLAEASLKIYEEIESPNADKVRKQLAEWRGQA